MTEQLAAMRQALEALSDFDYDKRQAAITSLRTAIEQAETAQGQEPVGWMDAEAISNVPAVDEAIRTLLDDQTGDNATALVQAILQARPSQPLTDEQIYLAIRPLYRADAWANAAVSLSKDEYRAIEAAHGITGETK